MSVCVSHPPDCSGEFTRLCKDTKDDHISVREGEALPCFPLVTRVHQLRGWFLMIVLSCY